MNGFRRPPPASTAGGAAHTPVATKKKGEIAEAARFSPLGSQSFNTRPTKGDVRRTTHDGPRNHEAVINKAVGGRFVLFVALDTANPCLLFAVGLPTIVSSFPSENSAALPSLCCCACFPHATRQQTIAALAASGSPITNSESEPGGPTYLYR